MPPGVPLKAAPMTSSTIASEIEQAVAPAPEVAVEDSKRLLWRRKGTALGSYLLDSEVHAFAFSVAANAILSFIPFIVLLYKLARSVFHSEAMVKVIGDMVEYFFPSNQTFVRLSLKLVALR